MYYSDELKKARTIAIGIRQHKEEYKDASRFFKRLEEIVDERIRERKQNALEETKEIRDAENVLKKYEITFFYPEEHYIKGRFGRIEVEIDRDEWELIDEGVELDESTFEEPENNAFIQDIANRRKEIQELDAEISSIESKLDTKLFGKSKLRKRLAELKQRREEIDIRKSESDLEDLILNEPDKRMEILDSIRTANRLGKSEYHKKIDAEQIGIFDIKADMQKEINESIETVVEEEGIDLERVIHQTIAIRNNISLGDSNSYIGSPNMSKMESLISAFLDSDIAMEIGENIEKKDLTEFVVHSMSYGELKTLERQTDEAIARTDAEIKELTLQERVQEKLRILEEKRAKRDRLIAKKERENEQSRSNTEL